LRRFQEEAGDAFGDPLVVQRFFAHLQERGLGLSTRHQAYRSPQSFLRWAVAIGSLHEDPMRGFKVRTPKTLPQVPTEEETRTVLCQCGGSVVGKRNRTLILVLADAGL